MFYCCTAQKDGHGTSYKMQRLNSCTKVTRKLECMNVHNVETSFYSKVCIMKMGEKAYH